MSSPPPKEKRKHRRTNTEPKIVVEDTKEIKEDCPPISQDTESVKDSEKKQQTSKPPKFHPLCLNPQDKVGKDYLLKTQQLRTLRRTPTVGKASHRSLKSSKTEIGGDFSGQFSDDLKADINRERKRQKIIAEMTGTEKTYIEFLQTVVMLFVIPLRKAIVKESPLLTKDEMKIVFQNIEVIDKVNGELLKKMARRKQKGIVHWADMLIETFSDKDFKDAYQEYINGYNQARVFISNAMKPLPPNPTEKQERYAKFADFVNRQLSNDLCLGFGSLSSFLITPIQRLPRYLLYLRDLHSCTNEHHPDRKDVENAYELLSELTEQIDRQKLKYDEIYHVQALYQQFHSDYRKLVPEILDPSRKLLAEGPILENVYDDYRSWKGKQKVLRYVLLFSNLLICASKDDDDVLHLEWKVDLYCSSIKAIEGNNDNAKDFFFILTNRQVTGGIPFMITKTFELFPFTEGPFSAKFWTNHLQAFLDGPKDLFVLSQSGVSQTKRLQSVVLLPEDWAKLKTVGKTTIYTTDETILEEGGLVSGFHVIEVGRCGVIKDVCQKSILLGIMETGELFGEMSYLAPSSRNLSTSTVFASSEQTIVTEYPFDGLIELLKSDCNMARRFFQTVCLSMAFRYLRIVFQKTGSFVEGENQTYINAPPSLYGEPFSSDAKSILSKIKVKEEEVFIELPCKMKGKMGKGYVLISRESVCYFSGTSVFGHTSKVLIPNDSLHSVREAKNSSSIIISYYENLRKSHKTSEAQLTFYNEPQKKDALFYIASLIGTPKQIPAESENFELSSGDWAVLTSNPKQIAYSQGDVIVSVGQLTQGFYQVVKGRCIVQYEVDDRRLSYTLKTGEVYGEVGFILGTTAGSTLVAATKQTVVRLISNDHLNNCLKKSPELAAKIYLFAAQTLRSRFLRVQENLLLHKTSELLEGLDLNYSPRSIALKTSKERARKKKSPKRGKDSESRNRAQSVDDSPRTPHDIPALDLRFPSALNLSTGSSPISSGLISPRYKTKLKKHLSLRRSKDS